MQVSTRQGSAVVVLGVVVAILVIAMAYMLLRNSQEVPMTGADITPTTTTTAQTPAASKIDSYKVVKPTLYVYGENLAAVKVLGVPTGTGVTEAKVIGSATLRGTQGNTQTWIFEPKQEQLLLTSMSVEGYDTTGGLVGRLNLPYSGASDVYGAFY